MQRYFPWLMAVMAGLCLMVSNGMTITGLPVFDESLLNEFGWDRGGLKFRDMVTFMVTGAIAPFVGILIDRYGVRACMMVGWVILTVAYYFYGHLESLAGLYGIHSMLGVVLVLCGLNAGVILVSHWFVEKRGTAIGIALVGTSLGGAILPQYGTMMIEKLGWRDALHSEMIFPVIMLILTFFVIRNKPEDKGLEPVGGSEQQAAQEVAGLDYTAALKTSTFWALAIIAMSTFYTVLGVQAHLFLYMRDLEFTPSVATNAISLFFLCALAGKFVFGLLADYLDKKKVFFGNILVMGAGAVCLATMQKELIWVAVTSFGLGWGGVYTMLQLSAIDSFGLKAAGKILGTITVMDALGGGLGIWLTGVMYTSTGSYDLPFKIFIAFIVLAMLCISRIKPVQVVQAPTALSLD